MRVCVCEESKVKLLRIAVYYKDCEFIVYGCNAKDGRTSHQDSVGLRVKKVNTKYLFCNISETLLIKVILPNQSFKATKQWWTKRETRIKGSYSMSGNTS